MPRTAEPLPFSLHDLHLRPEQLGEEALFNLRVAVGVYADQTDPLNFLLTDAERIYLEIQRATLLDWLAKRIRLDLRPEGDIASNLVGWAKNVAVCGEQLRIHNETAGGDQNGRLILRFPAMTGALPDDDWAMYVQAVRLQAWRNKSHALAKQGDNAGVSVTADATYTRAKRTEGGIMHHLRTRHPDLFDVAAEASSAYERWRINVDHAATSIA